MSVRTREGGLNLSTAEGAVVEFGFVDDAVEKLDSTWVSRADDKGLHLDEDGHSRCQNRYAIRVNYRAPSDTALESNRNMMELPVGKVDTGRPSLTRAPVMGNQNAVL